MNNIRCQARAFTLIELLFIVAVISVLAAISVPNFLEAQTRSKIARLHVDMAAISTGLSRYYADHGTYPHNDPEVRRYLDAAMLNPIMDGDHTTAPEDAKIPWYKVERGADNSTSTQLVLYEKFISACDSYPVQVDIPPLLINGQQLTLLTTPISYLGTMRSNDIFGPRKHGGFGYINSAEMFQDGMRATESSGLWGDHLTSSTYAYIISPGPDSEYQIWHPLNGPWIDYDATNGTASAGDFFVFEGRRPKYVKPDESVIPESKKPQAFNEYDMMGMFMF